jgi:hypothetical protein
MKADDAGSQGLKVLTINAIQAWTNFLLSTFYFLLSAFYFLPSAFYFNQL